MFLIILPLMVTGFWYVLSWVFPQVAGWLFLLGLQVLAGFLSFVVYLSKAPDKAKTKIRERETIKAREQFEYLYDRSPVPYLNIDQQGIITLANLAAIRLFKTTSEELIGQSLTESIVTDDETTLSVILGKLESGVSITDIEIPIKVHGGAERWVLLSVFVYGSHSERLVAMVDITHQKTVDQAKSEFVALASHQLRTPLAAVRWNVELLKGQQPEETVAVQAKYYEKIERNVLRMVTLINDFLSVSKLETGTFATELDHISLADFFDSVIEENKQMIVEKKIDLQKTYHPAKQVIEADKRLWHIIINNLLSNAIKYAESQDQVRIGYTFADHQITVVVADTGIGIPANEVEKLFTKFYRATNARSHKAEGTGLGLYIVKQSVEMMSGTVTVESEEGVGTTFTITIPFTAGSNREVES